jgi:hypothetical protein
VSRKRLLSFELELDGVRNQNPVKEFQIPCFHFENLLGLIFDFYLKPRSQKSKSLIFKKI